MRIRQWIGFAAFSGLLAGCTTPMSTMPPGAEGFRIGYYDGCDGGYAYAGSPFYEQSDVMDPPPNAKPAYASGWRAGFQKCATHFQRMQRAVSVFAGM